MKSRILRASALITLLILCSATAENHHHSSRSYMFTRPASYHLGMRESVWHNLMWPKDHRCKSALSATASYQKSYSHESERHYFLPPCCDMVLVSGDANVSDVYTRHVRAEWLGLPENFRGKFGVRPTQEIISFALNYNQNIAQIIDIPFFDDSWITFSLPISSISNSLNPRQCDVQNPGSSPADILEALSSKKLKYGRIICKDHTIHPEELRIQLGRTFVAREFTEIAYMTNVVIPLGSKQDPHYLFSAVAGHNNHFGMGGTATLQFPLTRNRTGYRALCFFTNLEGIFFFKHKQLRTFDLKGKPWSRFMQYNIKNGTPDQNIPGTKLLTREAWVNPYGVANFSAGWRIFTKHFEVEVGYDAWGHQGERLELYVPSVGSCLPVFGIAGDGLLTADPPLAATASASNISNKASNDESFVAVRDSDIDLHSAAASSALNHGFHVSAGVCHRGNAIDAFLSAGCFADFPQKNSALRSWGAWVKYGAAF